MRNTRTRRARSALALFTLVLGLAALAGACDAGVSTHATTTLQRPIAWGTVSLETEDPAVVMLYRPKSDYYCSSTLIASRTLLTARHCVIENDVELLPTDMVAYRGTQPGNDAPFIPVTAIAYHLYADLAIVQLGERVDVTPVPLFPGPLENHVGDEVVLVGYGSQRDDGNGPDGLGTKRWGRTRIDYLANALDVPDNTIPAGEVLVIGREGATLCGGDSGGPALLTVGGKEYVAGVASFAFTPCQDYVAASVRVDAYLDWIRNTVSAFEVPLPPSPGTDGGGIDSGSAPGNGSAMMGSGNVTPGRGEATAGESGGCAVGHEGPSRGWWVLLALGAVAGKTSSRAARRRRGSPVD